MKHLVFSPLLLALAFTAMAQTPAPAPASVETAAPQASSAPAGDAAQPAPKDEVATKDDLSDRNCLKETGSRLAPRPDKKGRKCINAAGRSYTREDIDRSGAIDLKDALRRLDPAVH